MLSLAALDAALDEWAAVDMAAVRAKSLQLTAMFASLALSLCGRHGVRVAGPAEAAARGSHVSLHCQQGYAVMRALAADGVIGDFRAPDMMRFGFAPLYNGFADVWDAAHKLAEVLDERRWDRPEFRDRRAVT